MWIRKRRYIRLEENLELQRLLSRKHREQIDEDFPQLHQSLLLNFHGREIRLRQPNIYKEMTTGIVTRVSYILE